MSSTDDGSIWGDIWGGVTDFVKNDGKDLALDYARSKWIDVETTDSDMNMPDEADLRAGYAGSSVADSTGGGPRSLMGGVSAQQLMIVGGLGLVAVVVLKKVL